MLDSVRVIAGTLKGRTLTTPDVGRAASHLGQAARDAVQRPRAAHGRRARARWVCGDRRPRHRGAEPRGVDRDVHRARIRERWRSIARIWRTAGLRTAMLLSARLSRRGVKTLGARPSFAPFDIVLLDPPYHQDSREATLAEVLEVATPLVAPRRPVVLEHARRADTPDTAGRSCASGRSYPATRCCRFMR